VPQKGMGVQVPPRTLGSFPIDIHTRSWYPHFSQLSGCYRESIAILDPPLKFFQSARRDRRVDEIFPISGTTIPMANQIAKVIANTRASGIHTQEMTQSGTIPY
jgi:hypothetical protein